MIKAYQGESFESLINQEGLVVVKFFATWCGPCKMLSPVVESLSKKETDVQFIDIDIDKFRSLALDSGVRGVPTLILYKNGKEVDRNSGFQPEPRLTEWLNSHK